MPSAITSTGGGTTLTDSASLRTALSDENGTGAALFSGATSPSFTTPSLGAATGTTLSLTTLTLGVTYVGTLSSIGGNDLYLDAPSGKGVYLTLNATAQGPLAAFNNKVNLGSATVLGWSSASAAAVTADTGLYRNAAGVVEINNGAAGTLRDLKVRDIFTNDATALVRTTTTITGGGTGSVPTLSTGPVMGNPTKWIPIDDNGTTRYIPAW